MKRFFYAEKRKFDKKTMCLELFKVVLLEQIADFCAGTQFSQITIDYDDLIISFHQDDDNNGSLIIAKVAVELTFIKGF